MKLSEKIALNAEIVSRLMCAKPEISIKDLAELAKEIIEESENIYSKERAQLIQKAKVIKCPKPNFVQCPQVYILVKLVYNTFLRRTKCKIN